MQSSLSLFPIGVRYMLLSALGFALMAACVKLVSQQGIPVLEIVAARALVSLALSFADIKRKNLSLWGNQKWLLFSRGFVGSLALMCVYYAIATMPLAEATVIQYLHPAFTAILAFLFLKEAIQRSTLLCIILSFSGLILIVRPDFLFGLNHDSLPMLSLCAALLGALGSAIAYVLVRKLSATEDTSVIIFYFPLIALPVSLIALGENFVMPTGTDWGLLLLVGVFTQIGQIGLTKAMQTEVASKATAYSYIQVLFATLLGWLLFAEIPGIYTWLGGGLVFIGALVNALWKR